MLEIIAVAILCGRMGKLIRSKGRKPLLFQIMLVFFWIMGEFGAVFVYAVSQVVMNGAEPEFGFVAFLIAIGGGVLGAGLAFLIASLIPPIETMQNTERYTPPDFQNVELQPPRDPNNPYQPPST